MPLLSLYKSHLHTVSRKNMALLDYNSLIFSTFSNFLHQRKQTNTVNSKQCSQIYKRTLKRVYTQWLITFKPHKQHNMKSIFQYLISQQQ